MGGDIGGAELNNDGVISGGGEVAIIINLTQHKRVYPVDCLVLKMVKILRNRKSMLKEVNPPLPFLLVFLDRLYGMVSYGLV